MSKRLEKIIAKPVDSIVLSSNSVASIVGILTISVAASFLPLACFATYAALCDCQYRESDRDLVGLYLFNSEGVLS